MTCASVVALCAVIPGVALAQSVDTGGAGQALTTGTITSTTGNVVDGGANGSVYVSGPSAQVTVDNATVNSTVANGSGLSVTSTGGSGGTGLSVVFTGTNNITGSYSAVMVGGVQERATIDTTAGGGTYAGGLNANSQAGSATILNGSNVITGSSTQVGLTAYAASTATATVASSGGSINAGYGVNATSVGGDVVVGQGAGITTAISSNNSAYGIGVTATTSGAGNITIQTGAGGTIDGGQLGIYANNAGGAGAISVTVGDAIGGTTAPTATAVEALSGNGAININATATLSSQSSAIYATSTGGAITVATGSTVTSTYGSGVYANSVGQGGTTGGGAVSVGTADQRVSGVTAGSNGVFAAGAGDVTVYAGTVTGGTRGVLAASQSNGVSDGAVLIDVNGQVTAQSSYGVLGVNTGLLASDTLTINTAGVTATGGSGISAQSGFGDITINARGPIIANAAANGGWDGIYAGTAYSVANGDPFNSNFNVTINATGSVTGSWNGIEADLTGSSTKGAVTINATGPISGAYNGVSAISTGAGAINLGTAASPLGAVTAGNGTGVFASGAGDVNVYTGAVTASGGADATRVYNPSTGANDGSATNVALGQGFGIAAISTGGAVRVNASGLVTGGAAGGVLAQNLGSGSLSITTAGVTAGAGMGIEADSSGGAVTIAANGPVNGATYGIFVTNSNPDSAGGVTVTTASTVTGGADYGISVRSFGLGPVSVGAADQRLGGLVTGGTTGILATGEGDVSVYASDVTGGARGIVAASQAATDSGTSNGAVTIDVTGSVTANNNVSGATNGGVIGVNNGALAANTVTIDVGRVTATASSAISALSNMGDITINASGAIQANAGNGQGWDAIYATTTQSNSDLNITINTIGSVTGSWNGIEADTSSASTKGAITVNATGPITATNYGVAATGAGAGTITVATTGDITAATGGVYAGNTGAGAVNIGGANGVGGVITTTGVGIAGATNTGALTITTGAGSSIAPGATVGIQAVSASGAIAINQGGDIGAAGKNGTVGLGIDAEIQSASATSNININSTGAIYVAAGSGKQSAGIYAVNAGSGAINVTTNGVIDPGAFGVVLQGSGPVSFSATGGGVTGQIGVYAASSGTGAVTVTSATGASIVGSAGAGVDAEGGAGGAVVTVNGSVSGATTGVIATSTGTGKTSVTANGAISGGTSGMNLTAGAGGLNLTVNGSVVAAGGPAINATSAGAATININTGSYVSGLVTAPGQAAINLATASGQTSTINVASGAIVAAAPGSVSDVAIRATGGSVVVNNLGEIDGTVDFSALTGSNTGTLNNAPGTVFTTSGTSNFGSGNAKFANAGTLQTQGQTTTFNFGGSDNVFSNTGTVVIGGSNPPAGAERVVHAAVAAQAAGTGGSSFVLNNLTTFANSGALQMINGVVGDSVVMKGAAFAGSGASKLAVDTVIGAPGSASDVLILGSSSGHTSVQIRDAASASFGAYNPTGTVIVRGATHAGDFTLDVGSSWYNPNLFGGALDKPGFFFSQIGVNPASKNTVLFSAPKLQAYQFATLPTQAQTIWYDTTPQPEHQGELRDQLASSQRGPAQVAPSVWVKVEGATAQRDVTQSWSGDNGRYSYDASYSQDITTELAGFDGLSRTADGWGVAYGMSGGYVDSTTRFDRMQTRTEVEGYTLNGYATLMRNEVFAQFAVGGDALQAKLTAPQLAGYAPKTTDVASVGASFETGVRKPFLFGSMIEPSLGLAYVRSTIGDVSSAGARFRFDNPESLRLSLGVRISGAVGRLDTGAWRTRYDVSLRATDEVEGANGSTLASAGPNLPLTDNLQKQFGEARVGLTTANRKGWTATASVRERFSGGYTDTGLSLGLRYQF